MNTIAISVLKGMVVALIAAIPIWWLPILLQQAIPDFWLAAMTAPPLMLGGYVAARRTPRPTLSGVIAGLVTTLIILSLTLAAAELWVIPIMMLFGSACGGLGAYIAVRAGHAAFQK